MDWRELCDAYLDEDLLPQDVEAFRATLAEDAELRRQFILQSSLHRALRAEMRARAGSAGILPASGAAGILPATPLEPDSPRIWRRWLAIAATIFILLGAAVAAYHYFIPDPGLLLFSAKIERVTGPVFSTDKDGALRTPAKPGNLLPARSALEFDGPGTVLLKCLDGTTFDFAGNGASVLRLRRNLDKPQINPAPIGKRITVENGTLDVDAAKQPGGQPLILCTPHVEITVVGTRFRLTVTRDSTRIELTEGKLKVVRYSDQKSFDLAAGENMTVKDSP